MRFLGGSSMTAEHSENTNDISISLSARSDEELVMMCRRSKLFVSCSGELIYRYFPLIKSKASALCPDSSAYDDLIQEGTLGLLSAVKNFNGENGAGFSSYVYTCIVNRMKTAAAKLRGHIESGTDSEAEPSSNLTPESIIVQRELFEEFEELLSETERRILLLYISGQTYDEISEKLGISRKSAQNAVGRARAKLREKLVGNGG